MLNELLLPSQASSKTDAGAAGRGDEDPSDNSIAGDSSNAFPPPVAPVPDPEPLLEKLTLQPEEIARIAALSLLIGSNPRSVKRFVNILRIDRAHVQSMENEGISGDLQSEILLLLLALSIGSHFALYQKLTRYLKDSPLGNISNFLDGINAVGAQKEPAGLPRF